MTWPNSPSKALVLGHRGASAKHTENTMASFELAIAEGADGLELDARLCKTGEVVVFHDDSLERLCGDTRRIDEMTWAEIQAVELPKGTRIPKLAEVLATIDGWINVEVKPPPRNEVRNWTRAIAAVITDSPARDRVLATSFHPAVIGFLLATRSPIASGMLFHAGQNPAVRGLHRLMPGLAAVHPHHVLLNSAMVTRFRRRGLAIGAWTVDDPRRAKRLIEFGVTALITNDPGRLRAGLG